MLKEGERICVICQRIVPKEHDCQVAKKLSENPVTLDAAYVHSNAIPTRDQSIRK